MVETEAYFSRISFNGIIPILDILRSPQHPANSPREFTDLGDATISAERGDTGLSFKVVNEYYGNEYYSEMYKLEDQSIDAFLRQVDLYLQDKNRVLTNVNALKSENRLCGINNDHWAIHGRMYQLR